MRQTRTFDFDRYFQENRRSFAESRALWNKNVLEGKAGVVQEGSAWYIKTGQELKFGENAEDKIVYQSGNNKDNKLNR